MKPAIRLILLLAACLLAYPMLVPPVVFAARSGPFDSTQSGGAANSDDAWQPWALTVTNYPGASDITSSSALLNGQIVTGATCKVLSTIRDNEDSSTGYNSSYEYTPPSDIRIYWGTLDCGNKKARWQHIVDLGTRRTTEFNAYVAGLTSNTTYYYRCNAGSSWAASSAAFTTGYGN